MELRCLTPEKGICFFGYYEKKQVSYNGKYFLFLKVAFQDREPKEEDIAEIYIGEIETKKYEKIDQTYAWNFQQGCMLNWLSDDEIIYNVRIGKEFFSKIYNIKNGKTKLIERPVSAVFPQKRIALSLNFSRLAKWRPGYGYEGGIDRYEKEKWPEEDGIYFVDLKTGKYKLILPLAKMLDFRREEEIKNSYAWFNHTEFSRDGRRFSVLNRWKERLDQRHKTRFITSDTEGKEVYDLVDSYLISHYDWKNEREIVMWAEISGERGFFILEDKSGKYKKVSERMQKEDGHCSVSKDERYILYDTYPMDDHQYLKIFDVQKDEEKVIDKFYSIPQIKGTPIRCDLHPRWEDNHTITFDSTFEGYRRSYLLKI